MNQTNAELVKDGLATVSESREFLKLGRSKIYELMDQGRLRYVKMDKARRIPWRVLREFAAQNLTAGTASQ